MRVISTKKVKGKKTVFKQLIEISMNEVERLEDIATISLEWLKTTKPDEYEKLMKWMLKYWLKITKPIDEIYYKK